MDYRKYRKRIRYWHTSAAIVAIIMTLLTFHFNKSIRDARPVRDIVIFYASYILTFYSRGIISTKYSFILISLSARHGQLNSLLSNQSSLDLHSNRADKTLLIKRIGKFYDNLCGIMETVNFTHSFQVRSHFFNHTNLSICFHELYFYFLQIMFSMAEYFLFSLLTFYSIYRSITSQHWIFREVAIIQLNWDIYVSIRTISNIYFSNSLTRQVHSSSTFGLIKMNVILR